MVIVYSGMYTGASEHHALQTAIGSPGTIGSAARLAAAVPNAALGRPARCVGRGPGSWTSGTFDSR